MREFKIIKSCAIMVLAVITLSGLQAQDKKWTLRECVNYAVDNNIDIKVQELNVESSDIEILEAKSNQMPSVSANLGHSWNIGLNQDLTTGILRNQTTQFSNGGLSAGWRAYNGKRTLLQIGQAELQKLADEYQTENIKDDIRLQVSNAYLQVVFNRENLNILQTQIESTLIEKERIETLIEGGVLPRGDIYETEATLASQEQSITEAENGLRLAKISLAQILQLDDLESFDIADEDYDLPESEVLAVSAKSIYEKSLELRNDIKRVETNIKLANNEIDIARRAKLPTVDLFYNYNSRISYQDQIVGAEPDPTDPTRTIGVVEGTNQNVITGNFRSITGKHDPIFDQWFENDGHSFGLSVGIPIYSQGKNDINVQRRKVQEQIQIQRLEQTKWQLKNTINQAYFAALNSAKAYEAAQKTLASREAAFEVMKQRFEAGTSNSFEFNSSKQRVLESEGRVLSTKYDYIFRLKVLEFYYGIELE